MYTIKGSWVGQTFALTKGNDSGGKKSRIRRSKGERKALVESFIKKHQKLNNGSFPSLNLTHKEVGGSFYTVREIVREVIQENKVLGPGNPDILKQHLFGSISIEHESDLFSANGSPPMAHIFPHHQDTKELVPSDIVEGLENEYYSLGDGLYIDGPSKVFQKNKEHGDRETLVLEEGVEDTEASSARVTNLEAAFTVETSPVTSLSYGLDDKFNVLDGNFGEKGGESSIVDGVNYLENGSNLGNALNDESFEDTQLSYDLLEDTLVGKLEVPLGQNLDNYIAEEGTDSSEEPVLNANTQGLEHEHQSFSEGLQISGLGKGFEKNEEHEGMGGSGYEEILKLKEKSSNGSVLYENFGKGKEESSIEEPVSNANTQGLEHGEQSFGAGLHTTGLGKGFEKNEAHKDMRLEFGDREISEIEKESDNGSVLNENFEKEGERSVEEPVLNANMQSLEHEHENFSEGLEISGLVKSFEKSEEYEDMRLGSEDREITNVEENPSNGSVLSENLEKGEIPALEEKSSYGGVLNEKLEEEEIPELEGKSSNRSSLNENLEKEEIQELEGKSSNESVLNENLEEEETVELGGKSSNGSVLNEILEKVEIQELEEKSSNGSVRNENLEKGEISELDEKSSNVNSAVDKTNFQESASDLTDARKIANTAVKQLEYFRDLVIEKPEIAVEVPLEEIPKVSMVKEGTEDKDALIVGVQIADPINGINAQMFKDSKISSSKQTIPKMATANKSNPNIQLVDDLKLPNPTLDRMNLESWKRTSDKHRKMPANPFLAYFKAFVTAFVKFWSE